MWEHEFVCLARTTQITPPSPMDKATLIRALLGPKKLKIIENADNLEFRETIMASFPQLVDGGGYELLRTKQETNRVLCVIPPPSGGYNVDYMKNMVSQAKIYIRPIQKDLSLSPLEESNDMVNAPTEQCMQCKQNIVIHKLREHLKECLGTALVNQSEQYHVSLEDSLDDWSSMDSPTSPNLPICRFTTSNEEISPTNDSPVAPPYSPVTPNKPVVKYHRFSTTHYRKLTGVQC